MTRPRVLLAHGNADCRKIYGSVLAYEGYDVDESSDLQSALAQIERAHHDVIVADLYLTARGADECLLRALKTSAGGLHIPFVVLTGWTTDSHREFALDLGADRFLALPVRPRELLAVLSGLLGARGPTAVRPQSTRNPIDRPIANGF